MRTIDRRVARDEGPARQGKRSLPPFSFATHHSPITTRFCVTILLLAGCTASSSDFDVAAFQRKLDAWKQSGVRSPEFGVRTPDLPAPRDSASDGGGRLLPVELTSTARSTGGRAASGTQSTSGSQSASAMESDARPVHGPVLNAIVDRVMEHVDSVTADAKVNFKGSTSFADPPTTGAAHQSDRVVEQSRRAGTVARTNSQPASAPPAEEFAEAAGVVQDVPVGWTGAIIYSQPGCRPCEREINAIRNSGGWTVGYGGAGFRGKAHFVVIVLTRADEFAARGLAGTPTTVYFRAGREIGKRITEFGGTNAELTAILAAHPSANRASVNAAMKATIESACPCVAGGVCTCMNGCRCGAACRCVNCPGRAAASTPLYYDAAPVFAGEPRDCGAPQTAANCGSPSVFVPAYVGTSSYVGAAVAVPSQVGFGISAFGAPLFAASIGACGPGGCHP